MDDSNLPADALHRPPRSFVLRAGRMGPGQQRALVELGPHYLLPFQSTAVDPAALFGRQAPCVLEIGFGMGETTATIAAAHPETNYLGIEVHTPGVGSLLKLIAESELANVRVVQHDAAQVISGALAKSRSA